MNGDRLLIAKPRYGLPGPGPHATTYVDEEAAERWPGLKGIDKLPIGEVRGKQGVLALAPKLRALASECGQTGLIDHLHYYLSVPYFGSKLPCLLLFSAQEAGSEHAEAASSYVSATPGRDLVAAVLLHEYRVAGVRSGVYIPADLAGDWTVLAPPEFRVNVAARAAAYLLQKGAALVLLSGATRPGLISPAPGKGAAQSPVATSERPMLRTLTLAGSMDETLARMGSHTRRNLRLARRRAIEQLQATFVPESPITEAEFLEMNREGFYPVPDAVAHWRFRSVRETPGGFLAGVHTRDGIWIALLGGRRFCGPEGACTAVDWQLNRTGFARFSPGSLIRSFLIEHEIARGASYLRFEGGTPHSMRSAFTPEVLQEWLYARPLLTPASLRRLGRMLPKGNLLRDFLNSPNVRWREENHPV